MASFDYIVCGSGSSGAAIAFRLHEAEPTLRILVLEAGPDHRSNEKPPHMAALNPFDMWDDKDHKWPELKIQRTAVQEPRPYPAGRTTGGGSSINGMGAIRGESEDYDGWAAQGCDGWDWASVLPIFRALEDDPLAAIDPDTHGSGGPIPIYRPPIDDWGAVGKATLEAALVLGHEYNDDLNMPGGTGASPFPINCKPDAVTGEQIRWSVNDGYLEPLRDATPAVEIRAGCHVSRLLFDNAELPQRVVGVEIVQVATGRIYEETAVHRPPNIFHDRFYTQEQHSYASMVETEVFCRCTTCATVQNGEVIVSCGAVQSPALLQRSGLGPRSVLEPLGIPVVRDLPVGENLQDHPTIGCQLQLKQAPSPTERHANMLVRFSSRMHGRGLTDRKDGAPPPGLNDLYFCTSENGRLVSTPPEDREDDNGEEQARQEEARAAARGFVAVMLLQCYSRGRVTIEAGKSATRSDPLAMPRVQENMLSDPGDLVRMRFGVRKLAELVLHPHMLAITETGDESNGNLLMGNDWGEKLTPSQVLAMSDDDLDTWMVANAGDGIHTTGTCRMGPSDDPRSVVDPDCRVLSLEGLRVADASVMPDIVRANTHLSSIVIGENVARKILAGRHRLAALQKDEGGNEVVERSATAMVAARL